MEELSKARDKYFNLFYLALSLFILTVAVIRAAVIPFCNDESTTFFGFIQNGDFLPYKPFHGIPDHLLNSFLAWICFHLFGDSPISLRLPNLLGLVLYIIAIFYLLKKLRQTSAKLILVSGLLLSFYWLGFFNMCRGYGLSMAFMALGFVAIFDYIENKNPLHILNIYLLLDLAACSNPTLILVVVLITVLISCFQLYLYQFFKFKNLIALLIHAGVILFWIKYLFHLQHLNGLHSGPGGSSYWQVTFVSLIKMIAGKYSPLINNFVAGATIISTLLCLYVLIKSRGQIKSVSIIYVFFLFALISGLILGTYLMKSLLGIDYPENRAAMVFYLLFVLAVAFVADTYSPFITRLMAVLSLFVFVSHYAWSFNLTKHPLSMYNVIPQHYYGRLLEEQKQNRQRITIQGNDFFEPIYNYMNCRYNGALTCIDNRDSMLMDADYFITVKRARKYYASFYKEIDSNESNDFVLLKRKQFLTRNLFYARGASKVVIDTNNEYADFYALNDTSFSKPNPLMVEINFNVISGNMPSFSWLVLSVDSAEGKNMLYQQVPLNRIRNNWLPGDKNQDVIIATGILPRKVHRLVCYLWNLEHQQLSIKLNSVRVFQVEGEGACVRAPSIEIVPPK